MVFIFCFHYVIIGVSAKNQRKLAKAIKRARAMGKRKRREIRERERGRACKKELTHYNVGLMSSTSNQYDWKF